MHSHPKLRLSMGSLTVKLTVAFLLVGLIGAALVAVLVAQNTRSEFDRFLSTHDQATLVNALDEYYAAHGNWNGVGEMIASTPPLDFYSRGIVLTDAAHVVVLGNQTYNTGKTVPQGAVSDTTPVMVNNEVVGYVLFVPPGSGPTGQNGPPSTDAYQLRRGGPVGGRPPGSGGPGSPDALFLQQVERASATSAGIAALLALILGGLLARTLTRPLIELTAATKAMAAGRLDQRVSVRSRDEIGQLATSFNHMSADLARASQLRKQMTADLAHDLRTPLSILRGYMEGLKEGRLQGGKTVYTVMYDEVEQMQRLVEDLRVLSLADAGELSLNRRVVDPTALLERTVLAYYDQAEQQGIVLGVERQTGVPSIAVDTDRMTQVLNNLVSNALHHTTQGEIVLSATFDNQQVYLRVRDTGAGIVAADLPFIFDRFYRADKSRQRTDSDNSGLGLAIAKAIVEAHAGTLSVESEPGTGTIFSIALPIAQTKSSSSATIAHS